MELEGIAEKGVSVVGLGKLGLGLALCIADGGFRTIGVDVDETVIATLSNSRSHLEEPGYDELLKSHKDRFSVTNSHREAVEETDVTFILVATPSIGDGRFSNRYVTSALRSLAEALRESGKAYHLFVISSTVAPGSTEKEFIPLIEEVSGRKLGEGFDVCFDPDFVALGSVVKDFKNPDLVIIGQSSEKAGDVIEGIHGQICSNAPPIHRMSVISGEIAKVSLNAYITMKISFANSVANICERIPGAEVDDITSAIGEDKRISPYYFRGGLAFGGTCFPRDTKAMATLQRDIGLDPSLMTAVDEVNDLQRENLYRLVTRSVRSDKKLGILGLAFKSGTPVIEESPGMALVEDLLKDDYDITVYDPLALRLAKGVFGDRVTYSDDIEHCLGGVEACVLMLASKEYKDAVEAFRPEREFLVVDCWRQIDGSAVGESVRLVRVGKFSDA